MSGIKIKFERSLASTGVTPCKPQSEYVGSMGCRCCDYFRDWNPSQQWVLCDNSKNKAATGMKYLIVASDFSDAPGARYKTDGKNSGQEFYETLLEPTFQRCIEDQEKLHIDLDNTNGYAASFLDQCFSELSKKYTSKLVSENIVLKSEQEPQLITEIEDYIFNADN